MAIGPSTVWNFTVWTYPGPALALIWAVAALALVGRRAARPPMPLRLAAGAAALLIAIAGTLLVVLPAVRPADVPIASALVRAGKGAR